MVARSGVRTRRKHDGDAPGGPSTTPTPDAGVRGTHGAVQPDTAMSIYELERTENAAEIGELLSESDSVAVRARAAEAL